VAVVSRPSETAADLRLTIVYAGGRDRDGPARKLYERVGFHRRTRVVELRKAH
jgi:hypothetical protein